MPNVLIGTTISESRTQLYKLAEDYKFRVQWNETTQRIRYENNCFTSQVGLLSSRRLPASLKFSFNRILALVMTLEHLAVARPALYATNMLNGPFFFSTFIGSWRFESLSDGSTQVWLDYRFRSAWPLLKWAIDPLIKRLLTREATRILQEFKRVAENTDILRRL